MSRRPLIRLAVLALLVSACSAGASTTATLRVSATPVASGTPSPPPSPSVAFSVPTSASPAPSLGVPSSDQLGADYAGLAFVRPVPPDGSGASQVFVVGADGAAQQITHYDAADDYGGATWVRWSPDGSRLAVNVGLMGASRIEIMDADGGSIVRLSGGMDIEWSPDSTRLVMTDIVDVVMPGSPPPAVRVLDPAAGTDVKVGQGFFPHWDDNQTISAYQAVGQTATDPGEPTIFLFPADGSGGQTVLSTGQREAIWSPDHTRLAEVGWNGDCGAPCSHVVLSGGGLSDTIAPASHPVWSPDSSAVAYLIGDASTVGTYDLASGERTLAAIASDMAWSPDGRRLALEAENAVIRAVVVIDAVNEDQLLVTLGSSPSWRASG